MTEFHSVSIGAHALLGAIAVIAGVVALAVRKGSAPHVSAGRVFALTMGLSSGLGAVLGLMKMESFYITFHAGVLGLTLILSSWLTVRLRAPHRSAGGVAISLVNLANTAGLIAIGLYAQTLPESIFFGFHAADYFFLSVMAGVAAIFDMSLFFRQEFTNKHRIARHLWRMCLGFFIAAGSAFTGPGAAVFPEAIRNSGVLSLPELIIISLMMFWLARILLQRPTPERKAAA